MGKANGEGNRQKDNESNKTHSMEISDYEQIAIYPRTFEDMFTCLMILAYFIIMKFTFKCPSTDHVLYPITVSTRDVRTFLPPFYIINLSVKL